MHQPFIEDVYERLRREIVDREGYADQNALLEQKINEIETQNRKLTQERDVQESEVQRRTQNKTIKPRGSSFIFEMKTFSSSTSGVDNNVGSSGDTTAPRGSSLPESFLSSPKTTILLLKEAILLLERFGDRNSATKNVFFILQKLDEFCSNISTKNIEEE
eukprot:Trichotokara_eunicae@DN9578_c0_g1_i1.p1